MVSFSSDGKAIMMVFIGALVAAVFLGTIADSVFTETNILSRINNTVTFSGTANSSLDIEGRELVSTIEIYNATNSSKGLTSSTSGVFLQTGTSSTTGLLTVQIVVNDTAVAYIGEPINVTYTYKPDGYLNNAGARSISTLILIFGALAIVVFIIVTFIKFGSMGQLIRSK